MAGLCPIGSATGSMKRGDGAVQKANGCCGRIEQPISKVRWNERSSPWFGKCLEMLGIVNIGRSLLFLLSALSLAGQPPVPPRVPVPPPPVPGGPPPPGGRQGVRQRLTEARPAAEPSRKILALAKAYLEKSESLEGGSPFASTRVLIAADALIRAAEHQQHLQQKDGPPPPVGSEIMRHVERVYFRLQQADYFVKQSADPNAPAIADFARQYYQAALRAADNGDLRTADESAKSTDELMRALENLALSTAVPPKQGPESRKP